MMTVQITMQFTTQTGEYLGASYADYFRDDGIVRAEQAETTEAANAILAETYRGPDVDGIGVGWTIWDDSTIKSMIEGAPLDGIDLSR
jgi:hypothetical protein